MRRRAGKHRDRRRLLCPLFEKRRPADRAERRRPRAGQGAGRMVRRAPDPRDRRADAARRHGARRDRRLVPVEPRARHEADVGDSRTGGQGGRGRLCRDAARRGRLGAQRIQAARSAYRQGDAARRQGAAGRRHDTQPGAGPHPAPHRPRGARGVLRGRGGARHRQPAEGTRRAARGGGFRGAALEVGRADPRLLSRLRRLRMPAGQSGPDGADDPEDAGRLCSSAAMRSPRPTGCT